MREKSQFDNWQFSACVSVARVSCPHCSHWCFPIAKFSGVTHNPMEARPTPELNKQRLASFEAPFAILDWQVTWEGWQWHLLLAVTTIRPQVSPTIVFAILALLQAQRKDVEVIEVAFQVHDMCTSQGPLNEGGKGPPDLHLDGAMVQQQCHPSAACECTHVCCCRPQPRQEKHTSSLKTTLPEQVHLFCSQNVFCKTPCHKSELYSTIAGWLHLAASGHLRFGSLKKWLHLKICDLHTFFFFFNIDCSAMN